MIAIGQKEITPPVEESPRTQVFEAEAGEDKMRLDLFLAGRLPEQSRARIQAIIKNGGVIYGEGKPRASDLVRTGQKVEWTEPETIPFEKAEAEEIAIDILFEDDDLLVLNKPAGMVVHPGAGNLTGTLVSALLHHCGSLSSIGGVERPGVVHRLDKETSGCLVIAKNDVTHRDLAAQFEQREVRKVYLAVTEFAPKPKVGTVEKAIGRHPVNRQKMTISDRGRSAVTDYRLIGTKDNLCLVECSPKTGRTHQIRVHLKFLGCPVAGDAVYGKRGKWERHLLHAWKLTFRHPKTGKEKTFEAKPPEEFRFA